MQDKLKSSSGTQLLDRALDLVDLVERSEQRLTAGSIAHASGYSKPTVNRILAALVRRGFLAIDRRDQSYELGVRFTQLAAALRRSHDLVTIVEGHLIDLSSRSGETVSLGVPETTAVRLVGRYHMGLETVPGGPTGSRRPYHASAIGKAILSGMSEKLALRQINRNNLERFTDHTLLDRGQLFADLQLTRARGYALDNEEIVTGVCCVAVPLYAADGTVIAALSLAAPAHRMTAQRVDKVVAALNVIAKTARERLSAPARTQRSIDGMTCLHLGGLFHPVAMATAAGQIRVIDAAAPALHTFSGEGALLETTALPWLPKAAALASDSSVLLARGPDIYFLRPGHQERRVPFPETVTAITFAPDGRGFALTAGGMVYDALSASPLFHVQVVSPIMTVAGGFLCLPNAQAGIALHDLTTGKLAHNIAIEETTAESAVATDSHIWIAGNGRITQIEIVSGKMHWFDAPERRITAMAIEGDDLLLSGANMDITLADFDEAGRSAGSLYRSPAVR
jgi:DNA-binding IclR family transcriptional regulator